MERSNKKEFKNIEKNHVWRVINKRKCNKIEDYSVLSGCSKLKRMGILMLD